MAKTEGGPVSRGSLRSMHVCERGVRRVSGIVMGVIILYYILVYKNYLGRRFAPSLTCQTNPPVTVTTASGNSNSIQLASSSPDRAVAGGSVLVENVMLECAALIHVLPKSALGCRSANDVGRGTLL